LPEAGALRLRAVPAPLALTALVLAAAMAALFAPLWGVCWLEWWRDGGTYSHGILIPPLALFMIWQRRDRLAGLPLQPAASALSLVLLALGIQLFGRWSHSTMVQWASFLMLSVAGIAFVAGWRWVARLAVPLLFLTFMVPMSAMLTQPVICAAQRISTAVAAAMLRGAGFGVTQLGTILQLESYTLNVALPCSGFKTLIALSAFSTCFIYLLNGSLWKKLLLFGAAILLALLVNGLRIALVGVSGELISETCARWVHDNGGLPVTALALGGLFLMARVLKCPLATSVSAS
jgi:exosortase